MKRRPVQLIITLIGVAFLVYVAILLFRPFDPNYKIDDTSGIKNIISQIEELTPVDSIYKVAIRTQNEEPEMTYLDVSVNNGKNNGTASVIAYNRFAILSDDQIKTKDVPMKKLSTKYCNVSTLSEVPALIDQCKKLIPAGYLYRHTEAVEMTNSKISIIKLAIKPENDKDIKKSPFVYTVTYKKRVASGRRKTTVVDKKYYRINFVIDEDGTISPQQTVSKKKTNFYSSKKVR